MSKPLTAFALLGAAGISAIALTDAITFGLTGESSGATQDRGVTAPYVLSGLAHVGAYVAFAAVLHERRTQIDGTSRFRKVVRVALTVALTVLALTLFVGTSFSVVTGEVPDNPLFGAVAGLAFLLMFVASLALGISLLHRPGFRLAAWTLTAIIGALALVSLLGAIGSPWAHPAYVEILAAFGVAFIALAPRHDVGVGGTSVPQPTARQPRLAQNPS